MKQHLVDLLPDSIRTRSEAGMVIGRYITIAIVVVIALVALSTHAHIRLEQIRSDYEAAEEKSRQVLAVEAEAKRLRNALSEIAQSLKEYDRIAPPLRMVDLQALIISQFPPSMTLESLDMRVEHGPPAFDPRLKETKNAKPVRELRAELTGFARSDLDVSELVKRLDSLELLSGVALDYSRSRMIRERQAREFRVSFRVDLERTYEVTYVESKAENRVASGEDRDVE